MQVNGYHPTKLPWHATKLSQLWTTRRENVIEDPATGIDRLADLSFLPKRDICGEPAYERSQVLQPAGISPFQALRPSARNTSGECSWCFQSPGAASVAYKQDSQLWTTPEEKLICLSLTWKPDLILERLADLGHPIGRLRSVIPGQKRAVKSTPTRGRQPSSLVTHHPVQIKSRKPFSVWNRYHQTYISSGER